MKRYIALAVATVFFAFHVLVGSAIAIDLDPEVRTVKLNPEGENITLTNKQAERGKRLFNDVCAQCHNGGETKTNPNVNLSQSSLERANPARDNLEALVDYMKNPTTYDGFEEIPELHPNTQRSDLYPEMRNLTESELRDIAGHILIQQQVLGPRWGGGKVYF
ncbi:photosystem II cytochrome c-550 [Geitlerinema sp. PCC 9228]|jgi:photosystem II cytochrome c550|uniref:photosystem II cytochrome c-550 n=1 Tax=Geitlerinema sp. PCC 9228 TaxID=111611 RepID=UPI0008F999AF|nr:photosystem II cytochrome c-550 [Geitlerinema sp. PCC 9228]